MSDVLPEPDDGSRAAREQALLRDLAALADGEGHRLLDAFMDNMDDIEDQMEALRKQRKLLKDAALLRGFHMKELLHCWKLRRMMEKEPDKFLRQKIGEDYANVYRLASGLPGFAEPRGSIDAVVQDAPDSLDFFPTPPWATRALCEYVIDIDGLDVWETACGQGHMAKPLAEYAAKVFASDVYDYGFGEVGSFVGCGPDVIPPKQCDWIITNPPFNLAEQFLMRALAIADIGVALLVRSSWLESVGRYREIFSKDAVRKVAQFVERVPMVKGRYDPKASSATSYAWVIFMNTPAFCEFCWIPPCRKRLERADDVNIGAQA